MVGMDKISFGEMTSLIKFNFFCFMEQLYIKPCKAQNDKPREIWCFLLYVEDQNMNLAILHKAMQNIK